MKDLRNTSAEALPGAALSEREALQLGKIVVQQLAIDTSDEQLAAQRLRLARAFAPSRHAAYRRWDVTRVWHGLGEWVGARTTAVALGGVAAAVVVGIGLGASKYRSAFQWQTSRGVELSAEPIRVAASQGSDAESKMAKPQATRGTWRDRGRGTTAILAADSWLQADKAALELEWVPEGKVDATNSLRLERGARARVLSAGDDGLVLSLEHGNLVVEGDDSAVAPFEVFAGPYSVRSTEAVYDLSWSAETRRLALSVQTGSAVLKETVVSELSRDKRAPADDRSAEAPRVISAGQRVELGEPGREQKSRSRASLKDASQHSTAQHATAQRGSTVALRGGGEALGRSGNGDETASAGQSAQNTAATPTIVVTDPGRWKALAESGQYRDAVAAAGEVGFDAVQAKASASDLLLLADAARLGGAPSQAKAALQVLRQNFPSHTNAAIAAFTLGRMAQELDHNDQAALKWYRTYLRQEPKGRMAEGARARVLKGALRVGTTEEVQAAARDYLAHHPSGSSAALARQSL